MSKIKELQAQRDDLENRIAALTSEADPIRIQLANLDRQRDKLRHQLKKVKNLITAVSEKPRVSDHAVIRYLERRYGFSFDDVRDELLTPVVVAAIDAGVDGVKMNGGILKIKGRTVVTYIEQTT